MTRRWQPLAVTAPARLDVFLRAALPHLSRRHLIELVAERRIRHNGAAARKGASLRAGDVVDVDSELLEVRALRGQAQPALPVIFLDEHMVAIDKPCGIASIAQSVLDLDTAANFLIAAFPETAGIEGRGLEAGFVHRLDTATSGALLAARSGSAYRTLRAAFAAHQVVKHYRALVAGAVEAPGLCSKPLRAVPGDPARVEVASGDASPGREVATHFRPLSSGAATSLLALEIRSGARHQIRAHLASLGHPIVGDDLYGGPPAPRLMLHASEIALAHPVTGQPTSITAPLPPQFSQNLS